MNFRTQRDRNVDVNLTPLIDVVFLLLIFFMVSTTFVQENEIELSLPVSDKSLTKEKDKLVEVSIDKDGAIYLDKVLLERTKVGEIAVKLAELSLHNSALPQPVLIIKADSGARHQSVIDVLDAAQRAGLTRITFATLMREEL